MILCWGVIVLGKGNWLHVFPILLPISTTINNLALYIIISKDWVFPVLALYTQLLSGNLLLKCIHFYLENEIYSTFPDLYVNKNYVCTVVKKAKVHLDNATCFRRRCKCFWAMWEMSLNIWAYHCVFACL